MYEVSPPNGDGNVDYRRLERATSFTDDGERITFSWENLTVQAHLDSGGPGGNEKWYNKILPKRGGGGQPGKVKTILKNGVYTQTKLYCSGKL